MTDYAAEQEMEVEALNAILMDDISGALLSTGVFEDLLHASSAQHE